MPGTNASKTINWTAYPRRITDSVWLDQLPCSLVTASVHHAARHVTLSIDTKNVNIEAVSAAGVSTWASRTLDHNCRPWTISLTDDWQWHCYQSYCPTPIFLPSTIIPTSKTSAYFLIASSQSPCPTEFPCTSWAAQFEHVAVLGPDVLRNCMESLDHNLVN